MLSAKVKLGDIFEISTSKGMAYLQYVFKDNTTGELIRILPGLYLSRPDNICKLAEQIERYLIFFPLVAAVKKSIISNVGNCRVVNFEKPKYMRTEHSIRGEFIGWHIVDTDTWQRSLLSNLTAEQKKLSPWGIWNAALLIEKLEMNWSLENWV